MNPDDLADRLAIVESRLRDVEADNGALRLQLDMLAAVDVVTGLANANGVLDVVQKAAVRYARSGEVFGLMSIEFPGFARVVERHGRAGLDQAMRHVGSLVAACIRQLDTVGRIDEAGLVAVLPMLSDDGVSAVIRRIERALDATPLLLADNEEEYLVPAFTVVVCSSATSIDGPDIINRLMEARTAAVPGSPVIRHARGA